MTLAKLLKWQKHVTVLLLSGEPIMSEDFISTRSNTKVRLWKIVNYCDLFGNEQLQLESG